MGSHLKGQLLCLTMGALAIVGAGCKAEKVEGGKTAAAPAPAAPASAAPTPTAAADAPSFRKDIAPVFEVSCASARGCHGMDPNDWIDLDLRPDKAYSQLVNRPAYERDNAIRVRPGDPTGSFLIDKLTGNLKPREGKAMPLDPFTGSPVQPNPISRHFIDRVLVPWIAAGAPNN